MEPMSKFGNTSSAIALATQIAIEHNIKVLLVATSLNDSLIKDSFWQEKKKKSLNLFGIMGGNNNIEKNGVEGLDRVIRSNRISPELITDYTKIVLADRLEILLGIEGTQEQYNLIKERYPQIISLASKYYDMVIVDLDKKLGEQTEIDILKSSDIIVTMISQRASQIKKIQQLISERDILREDNTVITIGKYMENTKYNAKNITRNLLKKKETVNTVPYNNLFFEASQEGKVIDLFLNLMRIKDKTDDYTLIGEVRRLYETIKNKISIQQYNII